MRLLRRRDGQIVIPAMLIFPALMLFVYLIYETAKLSREKIRHQFAMDAAAFVEMTNYSDFLNRTAYVNGAFPMRIFDEGYGDFFAECEGKVEHCEKVTYASILFNNGVFPHDGGTYPTGSHTAETDLPGNKWEIRYGGLGSAKNDPDPDLPEPIQLFTQEDTRKFWHSKDLALEIYKLYVQIYSLLGSVEDAQYTVLKRLVGDHSFMKKSYWLNTGEPEGELLVANFRAVVPDFTSSTIVKPKCQKTLDFCGNVLVGGSGLQPYRPECTGQNGAPHATLDKSAGCDEGLFQMMVVKPEAIKTMQETGASGYPGISLVMNWAVPAKNFFNVDFVTEMNHRYPNGTLHTTISLKGDPASKPSVWPNPTPKFQVRQYP
ncbi:MAG: hypothetical protein A2506_00080 [Elusimicrobia bacterium RIFOXYD12_FULL_66_9]|nr:MAG: hypothetical protein A2506_00080 [Elusimicrobia bacterium RIFOXYD12_FULL_66_9]